MNQQEHDHVRDCKALGSARRGTFVAIFACLPLILGAAGCASTKTTEQQVFVGERLPRPGHIWVYDFAATAAAVPPDSTLARKFAVESTPQTTEQIALGRRLGAEIATDLVQRMQKMGLPAKHAIGGETIDVNDLVVRGYLVCLKKGNAPERIVIGFGVGESGLCTIIEGFQMTPHGLRELTFDSVRAGSGKTPGLGVSAAGIFATGSPIGLIAGSGFRVYEEASGHSTVEGRARATAKEISADLGKLFQEQGWIAG
jgi:hypothetical protein